MQKIRDERLKLRNLKNIRITHIIQTLGIIGILGYDLVTKGMDGMTDNPLWFVLLVTVIVNAYLSMNVSVDQESEKKDPKKGLKIQLTVLTVISILVGVLVYLTDGFGIWNGILFGGIIFICGLPGTYYLYRLRKKKEENID